MTFSRVAAQKRHCAAGCYAAVELAEAGSGPAVELSRQGQQVLSQYYVVQGLQAAGQEPG